MNTKKSLGIAGIGSIALAMIAPSVSFADAGQAAATNGTSSHSLVHRVTHSLADSQSYTSSGTAGYKWGKKIEQGQSDAKWAESTSTRSGYKWGDSSQADGEAQSYAGASAYEWGTMNFAGQAGYRWGMNSFADQSGYRWGMN